MDAMNERTRNDILLFAAGELAPERRDCIERLLATDAAARQFAEQYQADLGLLAALEPEPLSPQLRDRLSAAARRSRQRHRWGRVGLVGGIAAAAAAILLALVLAPRPTPMGPPTKPAEIVDTGLVLERLAALSEDVEALESELLDADLLDTGLRTLEEDLEGLDEELDDLAGVL